MKTIYSQDHFLQSGRAELYGAELVPCFEKPERAEIVLSRIKEVGLGDVIAPEPSDRSVLARVHDERFLDFLEGAWDVWLAAHGDRDALPMSWAVRTMRDKEPDAIVGKLGYFCLDASTPITAGTWTAARAAADCALTGAALIGRERAAFALCRPPGHHAARDLFGGYCFLNNAAIAAQRLLDGGAGRVAILDVDYHHGNGTQTIFYDRSDVVFVSLHGDPRVEFPYFLGYEDERGEGEGAGFNFNYPLPWGTGFEKWREALDDGIAKIRAASPEALVISLGLDTFAGDPISHFLLESDDYVDVGRRIEALGLPTLFVFEGGYAVDALGVNAVNVLTGFDEAGA